MEQFVYGAMDDRDREKLVAGYDGTKWGFPDNHVRDKEQDVCMDDRDGDFREFNGLRLWVRFIGILEKYWPAAANVLTNL